MSAEELQDNAGVQKEERVAERPVEVVGLKENLAGLVKFGGFKLLKGVIKGSDGLDPDAKARRQIFLTDDKKKADREALKKSLEIWKDVLAEHDNVADMISNCESKATAASATLKKNLKTALEETRELEVGYRSVNLFYKNTGKEKLKNVSVVNATMDQLQDLETPTVFETIRDSINRGYDSMELDQQYSLLCLPGYLGSRAVVDKWAEMCHENKVMLLTDYENSESVDYLLQDFEAEKLTGGEGHLANVMMTCNYLVGRGKDEEVGEEEDVYVAPSSALAGLLYNTDQIPVSQPAAGKKFGGLKEVSAVRFPNLKKSELGALDKAGLIPIGDDWGKVLAMSAKTLNTSDNLGMQTYSVVRTFDYINKTLMDFLNRRAFERWDSELKMNLKSQIEGWLDKNKGPGKLIEDFKVVRLEQDKNQKDRILFDLHVTPFFPAKNFVITMDGMKGDDVMESMVWKNNFEQA